MLECVACGAEFPDAPGADGIVFDPASKLVPICRSCCRRIALRWFERWWVAMSDWPRDAESDDQSEFGLGSGMLDPGERAARTLAPWQEMAEIKAVPKSFDGSMPNRPAPEVTPVPRLLPGETEADRA